jgi:hypothetical protein
MDDIGRMAAVSGLPGNLGRRSVSGALGALDSVFDGDRDGSGFFASAEYIRHAKRAAEDFLHSGYNMAKRGVLVPVGVIGLSHGLGFPDLDISILGIGNHRFFLFHSALGLVALRYFYREWVTKQKDPSLWASRVKRKVGGALLGGFALGVGVHLAIDVFQPKSIVFPFIGSLVDGTLVDDNIWLLANSVWAFRIAHDVFVLSLADELAEAKEWVAARFEGPPDEWAKVHVPEVGLCSS